MEKNEFERKSLKKLVYYKLTERILICITYINMHNVY